MARHRFVLSGEYIELHTLLKLLALADSGGAAKHLISEGLVSVDGEQELRKTRKLRAGSVVRLGDEEIHVVADE